MISDGATFANLALNLTKSNMSDRPIIVLSIPWLSTGRKWLRVLVFELVVDEVKFPKIQAIFREMISRSQHCFGYRLVCQSKSRIVQVQMLL